MNINKSLLWGLAGLVVVILAGVYLYNADQQRRVAETPPETQISVATKQVDESDQTASRSEDALPARSEERTESAASVSQKAAPSVEQTGSDGTRGGEQPTDDERLSVAEVASNTTTGTTDAASDKITTDRDPVSVRTDSAATDASAERETADRDPEKVRTSGAATDGAGQGRADPDPVSVRTSDAANDEEASASPGKAVDTAHDRPDDAPVQTKRGRVGEQSAGVVRTTDDNKGPPQREVKPAASDNEVEQPEGDRVATKSDEAEGAVETAALDIDQADRNTRGGSPSRIAEADESATGQPVPRFDLLRVEPDGSAVIAGRAQPGTTVEVVAGDSVLTKVPVGNTGDFAAVLDEPLKPGDHEIRLREVQSDEITAMSDEVATVSVPEEEDPGSLFVMVTKPGEASRILVQPEATADLNRPEVPSSSDTADPRPEISENAHEEVSSGEELASANPSEQPPQSAGDIERLKPRPNDPGSEVNRDSDDMQMSMVESQDGTGDTGVSRDPAGSVENNVDKPLRKRLPDLDGVRLHIEAVEIEGDWIYVAGSAAPVDANIRIYVDGEPIGDSTVGPTNRFLVEAQYQLEVGQHMITADLMMPGSDATRMRVAVPFTRPSGNKVAALAAPDPSEQDSAPASGETSDKDLSGRITSGADEGSSPQEDTPDALETVVVRTAPEVGSDESGSKPEANNSGDTEQPVADVPSPRQEPRVAGETSEDSPSEVVFQPALQNQHGSVIIRRGDTLWQISRRVYGRGVRYTTIYLENPEHIDNPDLIEPGQVFRVPEDHLDNAEDLHRQRVLGR